MVILLESTSCTHSSFYYISLSILSTDDDVGFWEATMVFFWRFFLSLLFFWIRKKPCLAFSIPLNFWETDFWKGILGIIEIFVIGEILFWAVLWWQMKEALVFLGLAVFHFWEKWMYYYPLQRLFDHSPTPLCTLSHRLHIVHQNHFSNHFRSSPYTWICLTNDIIRTHSSCLRHTVPCRTNYRSLKSNNHAHSSSPVWNHLNTYFRLTNGKSHTPQEDHLCTPLCTSLR